MELVERILSGTKKWPDVIPMVETAKSNEEAHQSHYENVLNSPHQEQIYAIYQAENRNQQKYCPNYKYLQKTKT